MISKIQSLRVAGLVLAILVWLSRLIVDGTGMNGMFEEATIAPSTFQIVASALTVLSVWLASACKRSTAAYLLTLWFIGDLMFTFAPGSKFLFFIGMTFYGIAHVRFAYEASAALKGHLTVKVVSATAALTAWAVIVLTGSVSSALIYTWSFVYAQLVLMFATFSVANAVLKSFGDWSRNTIALAALLLLSGDLVTSIVLFNHDAGKMLGIDKLNFDLVSLLFGSAQLLVVISAFLKGQSNERSELLLQG